MLDIDRLRQTPLAAEPFPHLVVPWFLPESSLSTLEPDFPTIPRGGSYPAADVDYGPAFGELVEELQGSGLRHAVEDKFGIDLSGRPTLVTVRGHTRAKDGRIHTDSEWKLVTLLIYVHRDWPHEGGRFRFVRSASNLDDVITEVTPARATAVFFRCTENAWHGHTPHVGVRRAVQVNWVEDASWVEREERRHGFSSKLKRLFTFGSGAPTASRTS